MTEPDMNADIHHALALAVLALTGARTAVEIRSTPEQCAQLQELIAKGAQPTLAIRIDAEKIAHIEFHVVEAAHKQFFEKPLLKFDSEAIAALAPPGSIPVIDRGKMN